MPIKIDTFAGEFPRVHPRLLPDGAAQLARNVRLERGSLTPARAEASVTTVSGNPQSVVYHDGAWLGFGTVVQTAPGPVAQDRLYITGDGAPKLRYDGTTRALAANAPIGAPTIVVAPQTDPDLEEATVFAYTYVTDLDEETQPSPLSSTVNLAPDQGATISNFSVPNATRGFNRIRIYKSVTSISGTTELYLIRETNHTATSPLTTFFYNPASYPIQSPIPTVDYTPPPSGLSGIVTMPNGMMAAFEGRRIYFCEPYIPHAWPIKYSLTVDYPIVALCAFGTMLAILTEGTPYRAQGTHPDNIMLEKVEENLPCLSAAGAVDLGYACAYPSYNGLVVMTSGAAETVSKGIFTLDQWRALDPSSFIAADYAGVYIFSHDPIGAAGRSIGIIDLTGEAPFYLQTDTVAQGFHKSLTEGKLYLLGSNGTVTQWYPPSTTPKTYAWTSRITDLKYPENFAVILVEGRAYDESQGGSAAFACAIYGDGVLRHTITDLNTPKRLPGGFKAQEWELRITGNAEIERITLAETMEDLVR